jgi:hypothetical protein
MFSRSIGRTVACPHTRPIARALMSSSLGELGLLRMSPACLPQRAGAGGASRRAVCGSSISPPAPDRRTASRRSACPRPPLQGPDVRDLADRAHQLGNSAELTRTRALAPPRLRAEDPTGGRRPDHTCRRNRRVYKG